MKYKTAPLSTGKRLSTEAEKLIRLAAATAKAGSRPEKLFWEKRLMASINDLFENNAEDDLVRALDFLYDSNGLGYNELITLTETCAEVTAIERDGELFDVLLIAVPTLAWSRFPIPSGPVETSILNALHTQIKTHLLAKNASLALCDFMFSPDQLPRSYADTLKLAANLGQAALTGNALHVDAESLAKTNLFLSDARLLVGAVVVRRDQPFFCWQEKSSERDAVLRLWIKHGTPNLQPLFAGCSFQPLLIDAYHVACRFADQASRAYSLQSSVQFLQTVWDIVPDTLRCVIGACHDKELEEYRISFLNAENNTVIHGVVWPLADAETEGNGEVLAEVEETLRACGIKNIISHDQHFPMEFCDDCGAPMFPNPDGELVHTEPPEDQENASALLH